jgi:hypothetical protein
MERTGKNAHNTNIWTAGNKWPQMEPQLMKNANGKNIFKKSNQYSTSLF